MSTPNFKIAKIQFETRYSHLLHFNDVYKRVFTPFLRESNINYQLRKGNFTDEIAMSFNGSFYEIEARFDRMIFRQEGFDTDTVNQKSKFVHFMEAFEKVRDDQLFGQDQLSFIAIWGVKIIDNKSIEDNLKDFYDKFFKFLPNESYKDLGIIVENQESGFRLEFGPYTEKDLQKLDLKMDHPNNRPLRESRGILAIATKSTNQTPSFSVFKKNLNSLIETVNKLF